jgi:para-nitrobenzyl esterase
MISLNKVPWLPLLLLMSLFPLRVFSQRVVPTNAGRVSGTLTADRAVALYRGIPFAAPPVGELRWKAPQPVKPWKGVLKAEQFGPSAMQGTPAPFSMWSAEFLIPKVPISEDCLYLNVWTGATAAAGTKKQPLRPVLVWIYGGGFNSGGSGVPIYDGEAMARKGIVFVSINYRVGPFGFLAHPELSAETPAGVSGNYGLLDQLAALRWVQQNIAAFGGDPANVTIAGQSAGSMSVNCLVASPLARGLFQKAIAQSGGSFTRGNPTLREAEQAGLKTLEPLQVSSLAALRALPAEEILKKARGGFRPIIDGYVLPRPIADIFAADQQNKVALLTGWNQDEGLVFGPMKNAVEFQKQVQEQYGAEAGTLLGYFPAGSDQEAAQSQLNLSRDLGFGIHNYAWATLQADRPNQQVYLYRFTRKVPATGEYAKYGAFHTGEVPYAYDNLNFVDRPWETEDRQLARVMSDYWANFIKTGDPNGAGLPAWPAFTGKNKQVMLLGKEQTAAPLPDQAALDFLYKTMTSR